MYKVNNKKANIRELNNYMLAKTLGMFHYSGLPETIPQRELERLLQTKGYAFITEVDGNLYAFHGALGGTVDVYGLPTEIVISNPALNLNKTLNLKNDGVLIVNDSMAIGLYPIFERFNTLLVENFITMNMNSFNTRMTKVISASDDRTRESANAYIKKLEDGEQTVIGEHAFFEGVKVHGNNGNSTPSLTSLIEYHQYLRALMYNEVGIDLPYNMKRERLNTAEVEQETGATQVLVNNLYQCRLEGLEKVNEKYGLSVTVEFSGVWKNARSERNIEEGGENVSETGIVGVDETGAEQVKQTIRQFLNGSDLWEAINNVKPFPFIDETTNNLFLAEYGQMPLFSGIEGDTVENVAKYVVRLFGDKWEQLLSAAGVSLAADSVRTVKETTDTDETRETATTDTDKTSAFNSDQLIDEGGKETEGTETREVATVKTITDEIKSARTMFENLQKADKLNIIKTALADVANFMKVSVY